MHRSMSNGESSDVWGTNLYVTVDPYLAALLLNPIVSQLSWQSRQKGTIRGHVLAFVFQTMWHWRPFWGSVKRTQTAYFGQKSTATASATTGQTCSYRGHMQHFCKFIFAPEPTCNICQVVVIYMTNFIADYLNKIHIINSYHPISPNNTF